MDSTTEKLPGFYALIVENPEIAEALEKSGLDEFELQPGQVEYTRSAFTVISQFRI